MNINNQTFDIYGYESQTATTDIKVASVGDTSTKTSFFGTNPTLPTLPPSVTITLPVYCPTINSNDYCS